MANKTNKAYTKRVKVTKNGALKVRSKNQCHYNARERNNSKMAKKGMNFLNISAKIKQMMLPHSK